MYLPYMVACTFFDCERPGNDAQLRWLGPLLTYNVLYLRTNFESQNDLYLRSDGVVCIVHLTRSPAARKFRSFKLSTSEVDSTDI